jgi:2-polyprenyl-6-methoxyphenol hydroxylase-like FAD-dependent oxidoreductase
VVGADGMRSSIARMVGAREYHVTSNGRVFMWAYVEGDPTDGEGWIGKIGDHAYLATPTDNDLSLVAACPSIDCRDEVRADREAVYERGVRAWPELHDRVAGLHREGPVYTMAKMQGFFRTSAGRGWVLVGDAGHFKDPTPGQGIGDALRQAERLSAAIVHALGGGASDPDGALIDWWRWRDDDAWEMYWFAHDMGAAGPFPPLVRQAQHRISSDPELTEAFLRVINHDLPPSELFTPIFGLTTIAQALLRQPGQRRAILREAGTVAADELRRLRARRRIGHRN